MKDAIKLSKDGVILDLEITPGSKETSIHGYNPWRKRIEVRIAERAQKGKANAELILFLSDLFKIPSNNIEIISGATSSRKSVMIFHGSHDDILEALHQNDTK